MVGGSFFYFLHNFKSSLHSSKNFLIFLPSRYQVIK
nr:MAG TPA: hypothetical protein [Caudoviricetes sp.]